MGAHGCLVVPAEVRKELGLEAGDELVLHTERGQLVSERHRDAARRLKGLYTSAATHGSVGDLLEERRQSAVSE